MRSAFRLRRRCELDFSRPINFIHDGRVIEAFSGDSVASALLASGILFTARSMKLHRPRGVMSAGLEEPNALLEMRLGDESWPNRRATEIEVTEGLEVRSQNCWPSLAFDVRAVAQRFNRIMPPGFYYKTFKWPSWPVFEGLIRKSAGLGAVERCAESGRYLQRHAHCDVLIIGAGPAGIAAACTAASGGARVMILESDWALGGSLLDQPPESHSRGARSWLHAQCVALARSPGVTVLSRTIAIGMYDGLQVVACERMPTACAPLRERLWKIRAREVVLATGAIERPLLFPDNDRPGILLAGALRRYLNRHAVVPGRRVAIGTNNDSAYLAALDLLDSGVNLLAVADSRADVESVAHRRFVQRGGVSLRGRRVVSVQGAHRIRSISLDDGTRLDCDVLGMSGGWNPSTQIYVQAGGSLAYDERRACFVPSSELESVQVVGGAAGEFSMQACVSGGSEAGRRAAERTGFTAAAAMHGTPPSSEELGYTIEAEWPTEPAAEAARTFVDFQHDVTVNDIAIAVEEGYSSPEHMKRYTTAGMSVDQGRVGAVNALGVLADRTGAYVGTLAPTTSRPPFHPVSFGAIVGQRHRSLYRPYRRLPIHELHVADGALLREYGGWQRPACYLRASESEFEATKREALTARRQGALYDASSLGKHSVQGAGAAELVDRLFAQQMSSLAASRVRYGFLLNDRGIVIDDGVVTRLSPDAFFLSTTTAAAVRTGDWIERWRQCEWPWLDATVVSETDHWAAFAVFGPCSRSILQCAGIDCALDSRSFPHMTMVQTHLAEVEARVSRVSFSGELSFEISVPSGKAERVWSVLRAAVDRFEATPVGVECIEVLRMEKGFVSPGMDNDGQTTPIDLGWDAPIRHRTDDFIGRWALASPESTRPDRRQLVGVIPVDSSEAIESGCHVVSTRSEGFVTSTCFSPTLGHSIGLALVEAGRTRFGEEVRLLGSSSQIRGRIVRLPFVDPNGDRIRG